MVTNEVVTEVVTGGNTIEIPIIVTTVTTKVEGFNRERKQVETRVSDNVMEMRFRWLRGNRRLRHCLNNGPQISARSATKQDLRFSPLDSSCTTTRAFEWV